MEILSLADLAEKNEAEVKAHIASAYSGEKSGFEYGSPSEDDIAKCAADLERFDVLIAYENYEDYEGSAWFLMRERSTGKLWEFSGGHCSCYGFEGQYSPEEAPVEYLTSGKFYCRGNEEQTKIIKDRISEIVSASNG